MKSIYAIIESKDFSCDIFVFGSNKNVISEHTSFKDAEIKRNILRNETLSIYLIIQYIEFNLFGLRCLYTKALY